MPFLTALIIFFYRENDIFCRVSSSVWFSEIVRNMKDCGSATIYLRQFKHPDEFNEKHRNDLLEIMQVISDKIAENPDNISLVGHISPKAHHNPLSWIQEDLIKRHGIQRHEAEIDLNKSIKVIKQQPYYN